MQSVVARPVHWLTVSLQLVIRWLGNAKLSNYLVVRLGFPCLKGGLLRTGHEFPRKRSSLRIDRSPSTVLVPMTAKGAGGVEPGPSRDHGGDVACINQILPLSTRFCLVVP